MQVHYDEGVANHIGPEPCVVAPRGRRRSVGRGAHRPAIEPRKNSIGMPTLLPQRKATRGVRDIASARRSCVVGDPGMCGSSLYGNREISCLASAAVWAGPHREGEEP